MAIEMADYRYNSYKKNQNTDNRKKKPADEYRIPDVMAFKEVGKKPAPSKEEPKTGKKSSNKSGKRKKQNGTYTALLSVLLGSTMVAFVLVLIAAVVSLSKKGTGGAIIPTGTQAYTFDTSGYYLSIDMESFTILTGEQLSISLKAYPSDIRDSVTWTSGNEEVLSIDSNGNLKALSAGVAAVTATSGEYSDAIAVEVVDDLSADTKLGLPYYAELGSSFADNPPSPVVPSDSGAVSFPENGETGGENGVEVTIPSSDGNGGLPQETQTQNEWTQPQNTWTQPENTWGQTENTGTKNQGNGSGEASAETTEAQYIPPTETVNMSIDTAEMFNLLISQGFTQYLTNACVYEKNDEYYGEVIVDSESVHIYIKNRDSAFDAAVASVLTYLLPTKAGNAWTAYLGATKDKTMTLDGRKVRIVMPSNNSHSQIIIYSD